MTEELAPFTTPNGIAKGNKVLYVGDSKLFPRQNGLARGTLKKGRLYTVEFVFPGDPEQIELVDDDLEQLYVYDMFKKVGR